MIDEKVQKSIERLYTLYGKYLDDGSYTEWLDLFEGEDASYLLHPRENFDAKLEGFWMYCRNKPMIRDRIQALLHANIFNIHYNRHLITGVLVTRKEGSYSVEANFLITQADVEGRTEIFAMGRYLDEVVITPDGNPKFKKKLVVPDSFNIQRPLAVPM